MDEITQDLKKKHILEAAKQIFGKFGFTKTTLDDVALAVGMKKASLYYYYNSKEDLFRDVIKTETDILLNQLELNTSNKTNVADKLITFVTTRLDYLQQLINLHNLATAVILEVKPICEVLYREFSDKQIEILEQVLKDGIKKNEIRNIDSNRTAKLFILSIEAITMRELFKNKHSNQIDYQSIKNDSLFLTELFINGLKK